MGGYLIVLGATVGTTLLLTPLVRRLAVRIGAVVAPDERRVHARPTPDARRGGHVRRPPGRPWPRPRLVPQFDPVFRDNSEPLGIVLGATIILAVGAFDDLLEVSAPAKVAGMVLAGSVAVPARRHDAVLPRPLRRDRRPCRRTSPRWSRCCGCSASPTPSTSSTASTAWPPASWPSPPAPSSSTRTSCSTPAGSAGQQQPRPPRGGGRARHVPRVPALQLPPRTHLHGRRRGPAARPPHGVLDDAGGRRHARGGHGLDRLLLLPPVHPLLDPGGADPRHRLRHRAAGQQADRAWRWPTRSTSTTASMRLGHGQRRSVFILWAWTAILAGLVLATVYTEQGDALVPAGVAALAVLLYTILHPEARRSRRRPPRHRPRCRPRPGGRGRSITTGTSRPP